MTCLFSFRTLSAAVQIPGRSRPVPNDDPGCVVCGRLLSVDRRRVRKIHGCGKTSATAFPAGDHNAEANHPMVKSTLTSSLNSAAEELCSDKVSCAALPAHECLIKSQMTTASEGKAWQDVETVMTTDFLWQNRIRCAPDQFRKMQARLRSSGAGGIVQCCLENAGRDMIHRA
jgi:hypothetical protein